MASSATSAAIELRQVIALADRGAEAVDRSGRNELAFDELRHDIAHPPVHEQLGGDQERRGEEEAGVGLDVGEERNVDAARERPLDRAEHEERQPDEAAEDDETPPHVARGVVLEVRPAQQLVERPADDEREVANLGEELRRRIDGGR